MDGGFIAPARRVGFYLGPLAADSMTAAGQGLLDRAILWAAGASPATPTETPTASPAQSASPSPSVTESPSPSPTATPSPTPTATSTPHLSMQLLVESADGALLRDLGTRLSYVLAGSITVSSDPFAPEEGPLFATAADSSWIWLGDDAGGGAAPNGQYRLLLKQPGQADLSLPLWLRRRQASLGQAVFYPNPAKGAVQLSLQSQASSIEVAVYSLSGELAARASLPQGTTLATIPLRSPGGSELASGLYLVILRFEAPGGIRETLLRKLAVIR
jgi:hypothetical protein